MKNNWGIKFTAPSSEHTHSEADLAIIADLVTWHLMPSLSIRQLMQLNSPTWNMRDPVTFHRIVEARTNDNTRDWYFPVVVKKVERWQKRNFQLNCWNGINILFKGCPHPNSPELSWSWSGFFHSDARAHSLSSTALTLPPLTHLPHEWEQLSLPGDGIIASAGGLLLIKSVQGAVPARRSSRLNQQLTLPARSVQGPATGQSYDWMRLLVCNPLTRECKELPAAIPPMRELWEAWNITYRKGVQATMAVDEHHNCYQVVLTFNNFVAVYKSTTNTWRCIRYLAPRPWAEVTREIHRSREWNSLMHWSYHCASALTSDGRLFFAEVTPRPRAGGHRPGANASPVGDLWLFEVDTEAGTWELVDEYILQKLHAPFWNLNRNLQPSNYDMSILTFIELVECMDGLYVVHPAKLQDILTIGEAQPYKEAYDLEAIDEYMPLAFCIMLLQGEGTNSGFLRIQVPHTKDDFGARSAHLHMMVTHHQPFYSKFFSCYACGSTIWVSILDYVLTYDVTSQESTTKIIPLDPIEDDLLRFVYRPSLHMRP